MRKIAGQTSFLKIHFGILEIGFVFGILTELQERASSLQEL